MNVQINQQLVSECQELQKQTNCDWRTFKQAYDITKMKSTQGERLACLSFLPELEPMPHQKEAAEKVLHEMHGRAILADEVGLGKTIEAGLVLKELMIKGLVKKVLILTPSSLIRQWEQELNQKFFIPARAKHRSYDWTLYEVVVTSIDLAKKSPHQEEILQQKYDMLIVDEAHRLKNSQTKNYQFIKKIKATYCLLLTATPIQNQLDEIYNLVQIVRPGLLGEKKAFKQQLKKNPETQEAMKQLIQTSMVRNLRKETQSQWTERNIETIYAEFSEEEQAFYDSIHDEQHNHPLTQLTFKRGICSSREACFQMLAKNQTEHAIDRINELKELPHHAKAIQTMNFIKELGAPCTISPEYKAAQVYLQWLLHQHGLLAVTYNGDFRKSKKQWMLHLFETKADVLITTDAGAEGLNLQHCRNMIHYDLPWNPMKLEQRIGRIHRYGQTRNVRIFYMILKNTVDEKILHLLYEKLDLFEGVVGELDQILSDIGVGKFEDEMKEILSESASDKEASIKLDNLIEVAKSHQSERKAFNETS